MDSTYKRNEMNVYRIVVQLEQAMKKEQFVSVAGWMKRLEEIEQQIQTRKFRMAVVGEFNRGKSSFMNALLGKRILPEDVLATTATINRVTYGEKPRAYLIMKEDGCSSKEIPVEELASYITKLTEMSAKAASEIKEAVVEYPTMFCFHDVDLIDTPGMNDMDDMNAVTINQLEDIDLAVVAINAQYPYSETENRFVVKLLESKKVCQIIFVITYFDMIRDREKEKLIDFLYSRIRKNVLNELGRYYQPEDRIYQKYHDIFDNLQLYGISSIDAMEALELNDMDLYEKSGFLKLSRELPQIILSSKSVNMLDNIVTLLEEMIEEYKNKLQKNKDEWKQWKNVWQSLSGLFNMQLQELNEIAERGLASEELRRDAEHQKQEIVKNLLNSLGDIKAMNSNAVQEAMLPVIQQQFKQINEYYQKRNVQILRVIFEQRWPSAVSRLIGEVDDQIHRYPKLAFKLRAETERLYEMLRNRMVTDHYKDGDSWVLETSINGFVFYWLESPIQAVMEMAVNQSVLPEFQRIVNDSVEECIGKIEEGMKWEFAGQISEIKEILDSYMESLKECIEKQEKEPEEETALLRELCELQGECRLLHEQIGAQ